MKPSDILRQSRRAVMRLRQIEDEIAVMQSRIGGQGTGFGTSIDHNIVLDPTKHIDDVIDSEREYEYEIALCKQDVWAAESLITGAESLIAETCLSQGMEPDLAYRNANDMCYAMRAYYVEGVSMTKLCEMTGHDMRVNDAMVRCGMDWVDHVGTAHLKSMIGYDDRTPEELRAAYGPKGE